MEQATRNKLRNVVTQCRKLLEESIAQELEGQFGIHAGKKGAVQVEDEARMSHLSEEDQQYRRDLLDHFEHIQARGFKPQDALDQLIREIAFTHLNRLCAYKMMEARDVYVGGQKFREAVSRGINSNGFKFYLADHPDDERLFNTGQQEQAYRHFLNWLGGLLSEEIGVLFNPNDPANRLYPRQKTLDELLDLLNDDELADIWTQDETIGWVYQYFTPKELRDQARKESQAPRNSYELAFRNQFFTPRYVVEFLTDNTLGRIWYEMRKGDTTLKDQCRYMVRRPNEIFLDEGQEPPETLEPQDDLSQEELLKQPVHVPHRPKKDPRELKILDPACGSGHFLLYCFDLLLTIYAEAWDDPDLRPALQQDYVTLEELRRDVPRLILAHNLHGIDIDLRCAQIAALALWLRCQRAWQETGLKKDRPQITRSNLVCAEPMPGEEGLLDEFLQTLHEDRLEKLIRRVLDVPEDQPVRATPDMADRLCELVRHVWDKMKLAGEAGSLLKIEEEIQEAIRKGQEEWEGEQSLFRVVEYGLTESPKERYYRFVPGEGVSFWERAEALVLAALTDFAEYAANGRKLLRKLFVDDAMRGFAFVDVCRRQFDTVLMNPPFGLPSRPSKRLLIAAYPDTWKDMYAAFADRGLSKLSKTGMLGAITPSMWQYSRQLRAFRHSLLAVGSPHLLIEFGLGVMDDATVEASVWTASPRRSQAPLLSLDLLGHPVEQRAMATATPVEAWHAIVPASYSHIEETPLCHHMADDHLRLWTRKERLRQHCDIVKGNTTFDDFRFLRLWSEVPAASLGTRWIRYRSGGDFQPFFAASYLCIDWDDDGAEVRAWGTLKHGSDAQVMQSSKFWRQSGLAYPRVGTLGFGVRIAQENEVFSGSSVFVRPRDSEHTYGLLGLLNSSLALELMKAHGRHRRTETIAIKDLPITNTDLREITAQCGTIAEDAAREMRAIEAQDEANPWFTGDWLLLGAAACERLADDTLKAIVSASREISVKCASILNAQATPLPEPDAVHFRHDLSAVEIVRRQLSLCLGIACGRFDCRRWLSRSATSLPSDLFREAQTITSSGAGSSHDLLGSNSDGIVDVDGILVDDADHQDDVVRRVRDMLEVIWQDRADAIEKEACEILGVKTLRDYFRKPGKGGFWDDHVKRYSKSRRKAPIYWLLQSSKKNYALWLYYHRLDKDILFKALLNYVEPKIQREENRLAELRSRKSSAGESGKGAKKLDREVEKQEDLITELEDFKEKLQKVANLHLVPDLNDGVVLNIAPLHELVPWKEAKKYWNELMDGKYEWSSIGQQLREKGLVE